jgi:peptidoglycan/xylan/chitin deacetylase (PgdA/CDA1 family)
MMHFDPRVRLPGFLTSFFKEAIWRLDETNPVVYLTFDDGPIPEVTPWVLEVLKEENIQATFFCVGENVARYPEIYKSILDNGHSVGNHTYNHLQGLKTNKKDFFRNIEQAGKCIHSDLFRPPHGWMRRAQYNYLKRKYRIVMWDVISCDYNTNLSPEKVFRNITGYVRSGSIVTFHDSVKARQNLVRTLQPAIRWIKEQGFRFEAIPYKKVRNA